MTVGQQTNSLLNCERTGDSPPQFPTLPVHASLLWTPRCTVTNVSVRAAEHGPAVTWFAHSTQVTQTVFARRVSSGLCAVTALLGLTPTDGCEISFFQRGKHDPKMDRKQSLLSHLPGALGSPGPPSCRDGGGCGFSPVNPSPESLGGPPGTCSTRLGLSKHPSVFQATVYSGLLLLLCLAAAVPWVLWDSFSCPRPCFVSLHNS